LQPRAGGVHVNAHHLSQQGRFVLAIAERVSAAAAIAQAKIKQTVRPKGELSSFVVGEVACLVDREQDPLGGRV